MMCVFQIQTVFLQSVQGDDHHDHHDHHDDMIVIVIVIVIVIIITIFSHFNADLLPEVSADGQGNLGGFRGFRLIQMSM